MTEARELQRLKWAELNRVIPAGEDQKPAQATKKPSWHECRDAAKRAMSADMDGSYEVKADSVTLVENLLGVKFGIPVELAGRPGFLKKKGTKLVVKIQKGPQDNPQLWPNDAKFYGKVFQDVFPEVADGLHNFARCAHLKPSNQVSKPTEIWYLKSDEGWEQRRKETWRETLAYWMQIDYSATHFLAGACSERAWSITHHPFQPEYPEGTAREWNLAAQLITPATEDGSTTWYGAILDLTKDTGSYNIIKNWVTNDSLMIHPKGCTPYKTTNYLAFIQCANKKSELPVFPGDERVVVSEVPDLDPGSDKPWRLLKELLKEEAPYFLRRLLAHELPSSTEHASRCFLPILVTRSKQETIAENTQLSDDDRDLLSAIVQIADAAGATELTEAPQWIQLVKAENENCKVSPAPQWWTHTFNRIGPSLLLFDLKVEHRQARATTKAAWKLIKTTDQEAAQEDVAGGQAAAA